MLRKGGRSSLPRHTCVRVGRQRCTVDRNRAAIKSYLSYCYLGRNSPQVGYEHARMVSKATTTGANILCLSLSLSPPLCTPCLYVHTVARSVHTGLLTGYILMVGFLRMRVHLPSYLSSTYVTTQPRKQPKERERELYRILFWKPCHDSISRLRSLNFRIRSLSVGFLAREIEGKTGSADRATPP